MDEPGKASYNFGPFHIDPRKRLLFKDGEPVSLAPKAFDLLLVLVENRQRVLVKDELMEKVWPDQIVEDANLTVNMSALRKALGESPHQHLYIVTVPGRGYRFVADVRERDDQVEPTFDNLDATQVISAEPAPKTGEEKPVTTALPATPAWRMSRRAILSAFALLIVVGALGYVMLSNKTDDNRAVTVRSIAVLPFKPMNQSGRDEFLEMGMADSLITKLGGTGQIVVRPISATRKYIELDQDPVAVGRELTVDAVLDGGIQTSGDRVRVTVRLIRVSDATLIWSGKFDERLGDIFAVEDSVSEHVAGALAKRLNGNETKALAKNYTANVDAYQLYLKGRYQMSFWTAEGLMKAVDSFTRATEQDPQYALAYVGLADAHAKLGFGSGARPPAEEFSKARAAAIKALEIDSALAEAHAAMALIEFHFDWNWPQAEAHYNRAIELNPNLAESHEGYSQFLAAMGRTGEALNEISIAERLDPISLVVKMHKGLVLYGAGAYERAIATYTETLDIEPRFGGAHALLGWAYQKQGRYEDAIRELEEAGRLDPSPSWRLAGVAEAYALAGRRQDAMKALDELERLRSKGYASPFYIAEVYAALGENDRALDWLEKAYAERDSSMAYLKVHDRFESLVSDRRFQSLLQRMGLTAPAP